MKMQSSSLPWWRTDEYIHDIPLPDEFVNAAGPKGVALVRAWPDGRTDPGWGLNPPPGSSEGFMPRYQKNSFGANKVIYGYERDRWTFAIVMRSVRMVCIDIDGKNGGLEHAKKLGVLPYTLAETSKSGDGYHLFYLVDDTWDSELGFGLLGDRIGIEQGVDIRATGCVYHHKQQRWNDRKPAMLPDYLVTLLRNREQKIAASNQRIKSVLASNDTEEVMLMQEDLKVELLKPIPAGKRNNTLFAIGSQLCIAEVEDWETLVHERAVQVGLDTAEADKLVANIERYGASQAVKP